MENIIIRCKYCNKEIVGDSARVVTCGCTNMTTIRYNSKITALDLTNVVMINSMKNAKNSGVLTNEDIMWQEARRQRKVRRLDFEVR
jgi:hypothetical protein